MKIIKVQTPQKGIDRAKEILYKNCDKNTVLFLSGGSTPKPLYEKLANEQKLKVGALAMVDDRYSLHEQHSNEFMIKGSGLVQSIEKSGGTFFQILEYGLNLPKTVKKYDKTVRFLLDKFPKRIAILGIGTDGHIASLPVQSQKFGVKSLEFVSFVHSFPVEPKVPRISLSLNSLGLMDLLIVLAFGEDKKEGIKIALKTFFKGPIGSAQAKKVVLITDQKL